MGSLNPRARESASEPPCPSAAALEAYGPAQPLPSSLQSMTPGLRLVGRAIPVRCPAGSNGPIHVALCAAGPGDVLVVDASADREYGYWGELMTISAISRGLAGVVVDGGVRDCERLSALSFPTFADRRCIRGTSKVMAGGSTDSSIRIGSVEIRAGDLVVGDDDGLVVVPQAYWAEAVACARALESREADYALQLTAGLTTLRVLGIDVQMKRECADPTP